MKKCYVLVFCGVVIFIFFLFATEPAPAFGRPYLSFSSPDGRFKVVVTSDGGAGRWPGQGGDGPGGVFLLDGRTGRALESKQVEMIQNVDQVTWSDTNVVVTMVADWKLPKR